MDKKVLGIIIAVFIIALILFVSVQWGKKGNQEINNLPSGNGSIVNPVENMPETNPFETTVNPMDGYKNPFGE
jgi:hypothetical protein